MTYNQIVRNRGGACKLIVLLCPAEISEKVKGQRSIRGYRTFADTQAHRVIKQPKRFKRIFRAHGRSRKASDDPAVIRSVGIGACKEIKGGIGIAQH